MKKQEQFLSLYREYETLVRDKGQDCKDIEDKSDDLTGNRLRMCRNFRNYLSHQNDPGFLEVSDVQIKFMQKRIADLKNGEDILKKHLKTIAAGTVISNETCVQGISKLEKIKYPMIVVVETKTNKYSTCSIYNMASAVSKSKTTKISDIKSSKDYTILSPTVMMKDIPQNKIIICTDDGTETGKLVGVYYPMA